MSEIEFQERGKNYNELSELFNYCQFGKTHVLKFLLQIRL